MKSNHKTIELLYSTNVYTYSFHLFISICITTFFGVVTGGRNLAKCRVSLARKWPNVTSGPLCDLRSSTLSEMKGINVLSKNLRGKIFLVRVGGIYLKKTSPILTKLAKYLLSSVSSRPLLDLRRSTVAQMKGINVVSKNLRGKFFLVRVGGRYLKKTSPILTKLAKFWLSSVR